MGVGLEQAAAYRAIPADPRDDEAPPVLGNAPPEATSGSQLGLCGFLLMLIVSAVVTGLTVAPMEYMVGRNLPAFSVGLAGYEGIDVARPGSLVSPAFNLTLRTSKTCADRAQVVLTYSGVALGWAKVEPRGCVSREPWGRGVQVVATADGVGLSRRLRERMASEWCRSGRVELDADVAIYSDRARMLVYEGDDTRDKVMRCKVVVMADGLQPEPEPCPWYHLRPYPYVF